MIDTARNSWEVEDPAEFLRNENGEFEVTSPYGHIFEVVCRRGSEMSVCEIAEPPASATAPRSLWRIRRLSLATV